MNAAPALLLAALALALPIAASAQSGDTKYCSALADQYKRYVGADDVRSKQATVPIDTSVALTKCQSDPARSIPVLEKALRDSRVDLPPRS